MKFWYDVGDPS